MPRLPDKRSRLIDGAESVFHRKGFGGTTLGDVAVESGVPLGNIYYYFKTREALAEAVIARRLDEIEASLEAADSAPNPASRLGSFLTQSRAHAEAIARFGCPYGCLSQEFTRIGGPLSEKTMLLMSRQREWMASQFAAMGYAAPSAAQLGLELLANTQGALSLGQSLRDPGVIRRRLDELLGWVQRRADSARQNQLEGGT